MIVVVCNGRSHPSAELFDTDKNEVVARGCLAVNAIGDPPPPGVRVEVGLKFVGTTGNVGIAGWTPLKQGEKP